MRRRGWRICWQRTTFIYCRPSKLLFVTDTCRAWRAACRHAWPADGVPLPFCGTARLRGWPTGYEATVPCCCSLRCSPNLRAYCYGDHYRWPLPSDGSQINCWYDSRADICWCFVSAGGALVRPASTTTFVYHSTVIVLENLVLLEYILEFWYHCCCWPLFYICALLCYSGEFSVLDLLFCLLPFSGWACPCILEACLLFVVLLFQYSVFDGYVYALFIWCCLIYSFYVDLLFVPLGRDYLHSYLPLQYRLPFSVLAWVVVEIVMGCRLDLILPFCSTFWSAVCCSWPLFHSICSFQCWVELFLPVLFCLVMQMPVVVLISGDCSLFSIHC